MNNVATVPLQLLLSQRHYVFLNQHAFHISLLVGLLDVEHVGEGSESERTVYHLHPLLRELSGKLLAHSERRNEYYRREYRCHSVDCFGCVSELVGGQFFRFGVGQDTVP